MKTVQENSILAIIKPPKIAIIPVRAPFLKVSIRAKTITTTNHKARITDTTPTIMSIMILLARYKNDNKLIINSGVKEYPTALNTCFKDSASPLIALPM